MNNAPILVLQMQRMGDLVLSFPLLARLRSAYPDNPLWVVGEKAFFEPLLPFSPSGTYFSYDGAPDVSHLAFHLVINLSHRPEAATLAGKVKTDALFGPWTDKDGNLFINGDWHLYRAALTNNNYYNTFHWADLNILDLLPKGAPLRLQWPVARDLSGTRGARIGLFLGASEPEKHPDAGFWSSLANLLLQSGHKPVLLGGKAEMPLGAEVARALSLSPINLTGHFTVNALAHFIGELDLLVTPDTGPMHIAAWLGTPVLNLSVGPVNPWETGPFSPNNHVVRAALECSGCWRCSQGRLICAERMTASRVSASLAHLFSERRESASSPYTTVIPLRRGVPGLELLRTARDASGLYELQSLFRLPEEDESPPAAARTGLSLFWRAWFGEKFGLFPDETLSRAWQDLRNAHPGIAEKLAESAALFALSLAKTLRHDPQALAVQTEYWKSADPMLHPFSGYAQLAIQNASGSRQAFLSLLSQAEQLASLI